MQSIDKKINNFLNKHRVFNTFELEKSCGVSGYHTRNVLSKLQRENKIKKVRNGIYTVLPENAHDDFTPPALLIAAKMTSDAVLGYRSALAFYGLSRSATSSHTFISKHRIKSHHIHGMLFKPCLPPKQVPKGENIGIVEHIAWDTPVRVVSKERLLADSLDRLDLSGGWEEVLNAFRYENALNWKKLLAYFLWITGSSGWGFSLGSICIHSELISRVRMGIFSSHLHKSSCLFPVYPVVVWNMGTPDFLAASNTFFLPNGEDFFPKMTRQSVIDSWNIIFIAWTDISPSIGASMSFPPTPIACEIPPPPL